MAVDGSWGDYACKIGPDRGNDSYMTFVGTATYGSNAGCIQGTGGYEISHTYRITDDGTAPACPVHGTGVPELRRAQVADSALVPAAQRNRDRALPRDASRTTTGAGSNLVVPGPPDSRSAAVRTHELERGASLGFALRADAPELLDALVDGDQRLERLRSVPPAELCPGDDPGVLEQPVALVRRADLAVRVEPGAQVFRSLRERYLVERLGLRPGDREGGRARLRRRRFVEVVVVTVEVELFVAVEVVLAFVVVFALVVV